VMPDVNRGAKMVRLGAQLGAVLAAHRHCFRPPPPPARLK
jgi:hypothetical protein